MRYFIDTEFHEDGRIIDLISLAVVAEDGRELYLVSSEFEPGDCNDWVRQHVLPHLPHPAERVTRSQIRDAVLAFVSGDGRPEFWGYFADYDWVVLCQLFGRMVDLPPGFPYLCMDLKQLALSLGIEKLPQPDEEDEHHALNDARWIRDRFTELTHTDGRTSRWHTR